MRMWAGGKWGGQGDLELEDALEVGGGAGGHEGEEVVDQVLGAAADDLEQRLCLAHLPRHIPGKARVRRLVRLACAQSFVQPSAVPKKEQKPSAYCHGLPDQSAAFNVMKGTRVPLQSKLSGGQNFVRESEAWAVEGASDPGGWVWHLQRESPGAGP